ncbi:hypothetical protein [Paraburkholderia oxyphila]|uniref:hypothetical protein n=1 Tax=Paraburkholderia oxyphila TaxID=614212 RepID=UPI000A078820|nr:hypothetical protein [Paraburkholderia oxyphila]
MNLVDIARQCGMTVVLDARIGQVEYHSVHGSLNTLERLVDAITESLRDPSSGNAACAAPRVRS